MKHQTEKKFSKFLSQAKQSIKNHPIWFKFLIGFFVITAVGIVIGIIGPRLLSYILPAPQISTQPNSLNNQEIVFESSQNIVVEKDGKLFWPASNHKTKAKFGKLEGKQNFRFYNFIDLGFTQIRSQKFTDVAIESDYTPPTFSKLDIKPASPNQADSFSFELEEELVVKQEDKVVFDPSQSQNICVKEEKEKPIYRLTCQYEFEGNKQISLNYTITDRFGNTTELLKNFVVKNVELPKLDCINPPEFVVASPIKISCTSNKKSTLTNDKGEIFNLEKDKPLEFTVAVKEGVNKMVYSFEDEDGFDLTKEFVTTMDTKAPEVLFTFLDGKKEFQKGSFTLKFKPNESVVADVKVRPYNETFENDPRMKSPLFAKTWGYFGGSSISGKAVGADEETSIVTKNDLGGCQLYDEPVAGKNLLKTPQGLCDLYNVFFVKTDITVKDRAGNPSSYQCTSYTWDPNKNPSGELPTECKKL
jgi:hypothetical protein